MVSLRNRIASRCPSQFAGIARVSASTARSWRPADARPTARDRRPPSLRHRNGLLGASAERPRSARMRSDLISSSSRARLAGSCARSASGCHRCSTPVAKRPSLRATPARIMRMTMSESSRPQPMNCVSKPSTRSRSARKNAKLPPRTPSHSLALRLRSGPSGRLISGSRRFTSPRARRRAQSAKLQVSGSRFLRKIFSVSACDSSTRLPPTKWPRLGKPPMRGDEIRPRDAVAVDENEIAARARRDRAIADFGETKAAVLLPDMLAPERRLSRSSARSRRASAGARAIVRHDDLEIAVGLPRQRAQARRRAHRGGCRSRRRARSAHSRRCLASHAF